MKSLFFIIFVLSNLSCSSQTTTLENDLQPIEGSQGLESVEEKVWRFAIISDLNKSYGSKDYDEPTNKAVDYILNKKNNIDFVISTGDMVAGQKSGLDYLGMWEAFHNTVTRPLKKEGVALYPSPGNHDAYRTRAIERKHYYDSWVKEDITNVNPSFSLVKEVGHDYPFSYAYTMGSALFISLDATDVRPLGEEDIVWLEKVLEKEKDKKHKFIYGHVPLLPFAFKKEKEYLARGSFDFLNKMEDLLEKYKVSVFFTGHSHVYYPGKRKGSTQYISVPLLGSGARYLIQKQGLTKRSKTGFLVVEYSESGDLKIESLRSQDYSVIQDVELPEWLDMPRSNFGSCSGCSSFPSSMFLNSKKRIIYQRRKPKSF